MSTPPAETVTFDFEVAWAGDYDHLLAQEYVRRTAIEGVLDEAKTHGRVLLVGKGGSGKSTILSRAGNAAAHGGAAVVVINLRRWSPSLHAAWDNVDKDPIAHAQFLLTNLGEPQISLAQIDDLDPQQMKVIIIDGLNEVRGSIAQQIIAAGDRLSASFLNLSVIASDRLVRRDINANRWAFGAVLPLSENIVQHTLDDTLGVGEWNKTTAAQRNMLRSPFFLNKVVEDRKLNSNTADAIIGYLQGHALTEGEIATAASAAYTIYMNGRGGRTFALEDFVSASSQETCEKLLQAGVLLSDSSGAYFEHHLFHDCLAARHLAFHPEKWGPDSFDAISFNASSFDAVSKTLEQLETGKADEFIRKVYDWNPYAAAYTLSEVASATHKISDEMKHVVTAMLAERRWDLFEPTSQRAKDALSMLATEEAERFLEAGSLDAAIEIVATLPTQQSWFRDWKALFCHKSGSSVNDGEIQLIMSDDSIMGWTAANVVRRLSVADGQLKQLQRAAKVATSATIRWRAVHVLGASPDSESVAVLFDRLAHDSDDWVRYGALRSLMEIAARSPALRAGVFLRLSASIDLIVASSRLSEEFSRAAFADVSGDTSGWITGLGNMLRALIDRARDARDIERWTRLSNKLDKHYAA